MEHTTDDKTSSEIVLYQSFDKLRDELEKIVARYDQIIIACNKMYLSMMAVLTIVFIFDPSKENGESVNLYIFPVHKDYVFMVGFLFFVITNYAFCSLQLKSYQCYRVFALRAVGLGLDKILYCGYSRNGIPLILTNLNGNVFLDRFHSHEVDRKFYRERVDNYRYNSKSYFGFSASYYSYFELFFSGGYQMSTPFSKYTRFGIHGIIYKGLYLVSHIIYMSTPFVGMAICFYKYRIHGPELSNYEIVFSVLMLLVSVGFLTLTFFGLYSRENNIGIYNEKSGYNL